MVMPSNVANLKDRQTLAYITGVIDGDGYTIHDKHKAGYVIGLNTISRPFADAFVQALGRIGLPTKVYGPYQMGLSESVFAARSSSKNLVEWYRALGGAAKRNLVREYPVEYLRGFYESEGSYNYNWGHHADFTNSSQEKLELVRRACEKLGLATRTSKPYKVRWSTAEVYHLIIAGGSATTMKFFRTVLPAIKRPPILYLAHPMDARHETLALQSRIEHETFIILLNPLYNGIENEFMNKVDNEGMKIWQARNFYPDTWGQIVKFELASIDRVDGVLYIAPHNKISYGAPMEAMYAKLNGKPVYTYCYAKAMSHPWLNYVSKQMFSEEAVLISWLRDNLSLPTVVRANKSLLATIQAGWPKTEEGAA